MRSFYSPGRLDDALSAWREVLTGDYVLIGAQAQAVMADTDWRPAGDYIVLQPASFDQVSAVLSIASRLGISLHIVSTGRNWGYGGNYPSHYETRVLLHLIRLDRIIHFDPVCGLITLEPGVTQAQLSTFLKENGDYYMTPTTGAGPGCSLVGNALERGYGFTPHADHFGAVTGIEAVLPDGQIYRSPMAGPIQEDGPLGYYKWGCGPYLDGIFAQSSIAIVTKMTIALAKRPKKIESFFFWIKQDNHLEEAVSLIQDLLASHASAIGGIKLISAESVSLTMGADNALPSSAWSGTGALYGDRYQVAHMRKIIRKALAPVARRFFYLDRRRLWWARHVTGRILPSLGKMAISLSEIMTMLEGYPTEIALSLAYSARKGPVPEHPLNPARDGCGLLWYAPVVPMRPDTVRQYVNFVRETCKRHDMRAAITLSSLSSMAFDSTLPLLFEPTEHESARVHTCLEDLYKTGKALGFFPYRYGASFMREAVASPAAFWAIADTIKRTLDPDLVLSPGRYHYESAPDVAPCASKS